MTKRSRFIKGVFALSRIEAAAWSGCPVLGNGVLNGFLRQHPMVRWQLDSVRYTHSEASSLGEQKQEKMSKSTGPLSGYRVLDLGQVVAGNFCGALLSHFGADVIKVEPPNRGDALRHLRTLDETGTSLWWRSYGRNRKCITVDLHKEEGREIIRKLAQKCDLIIENFRPGVMEKWRLGPKDLPDHIIFTRISGYGQNGPKSSLPGYASVCEAFGGFRYINGFVDRAPVRPNISLGDSLAGLHAAFGAVMALLHRDVHKGKGQVVDAAITESLFNMLEGCVPEYAATGQIRPTSGSTLTGVVPSGCWRSSDGVWVIIGGNGNSVYDRLMKAIGHSDMGIENPKYATDGARWENEKEICSAIEAWVASKPANEVIQVLNEARVPAGPILSVADIMNEPQYQARGMFQKVKPPPLECESGANKPEDALNNFEVVLPNMAPVLHSTPGKTKWAGPELGQHTDLVLREELGLHESDIEKLRNIGAI